MAIEHFNQTLVVCDARAARQSAARGDGSPEFPIVGRLGVARHLAGEKKRGQISLRLLLSPIIVLPQESCIPVGLARIRNGSVTKHGSVLIHACTLRQLKALWGVTVAARTTSEIVHSGIGTWIQRKPGVDARQTSGGLQTALPNLRLDSARAPS